MYIKNSFLLKFLLSTGSIFLLINFVNSATIISTLPYNITAPGDYELNQSLNTTNAGITILTLNNTNLDCKGFSLLGTTNGYSGIYISGINGRNITVKNCFVNNFTVGVSVSLLYYNLNFTNITVYNNTNTGVSLSTVYNSSFDNIVVYGGSNRGFDLNTVRYSNFSNLDISNIVIDGIFANGISNNKFVNVISYENQRGMRFSSSDNNLIINSNFNNNSGGITLYYSNYNNFFNSSFIGNSNSGIYFSDLNNNNTFNSVSLMNNSNGVYFYNGPVNNTFSNSIFMGNNLNIYFFKNSYYPRNNTFYGNYLENGSKIGSNYGFNASVNNFFSYLGVGNRWDDMPICLSTTTVNGSVICTNPSNYTINSTLNIYDSAPFDYRYSPAIESNSNLNSIFPGINLYSVLISFSIILNYFLFV